MLQTLSFDPKEDRKMLNKLCMDILRSQGIVAAPHLSLSQCIGLIEEVMPEAGSLILQCRNASEAHEMLRSDKEMRYKMPDIWQIQYARSKAELEASYKNLAFFLRNNNLAALVEVYIPDF